MTHARRLVLACLLLAAWLPVAAPAVERMRGTAIAEERLALVIGNAAYRSADPLDNPVNEGRSSMIFSWLVMLASTIVVSAWVFAARRRPIGGEVRVG